MGERAADYIIEEMITPEPPAASPAPRYNPALEENQEKPTTPEKRRRRRERPGIYRQPAYLV